MVPLLFVFIFVQGKTCENIKDQSPRTHGMKQKHQGLPGPDPTMYHSNDRGFSMSPILSYDNNHAGAILHAGLTSF
jgi:hypothetical protein